MSKVFYRSNPAYCVVSGDALTDVATIQTTVRRLFKSVAKTGRNPVLFGVKNNPCSEVARMVAEEYKVPVRMGTVAELMTDLKGRHLKSDNIQVLLLQTPEYAGSEECLEILKGTSMLKATLRMWSNWHSKWLNCTMNKWWVRDFSMKFLQVASKVRLSDEEKSHELVRKMVMLRKYPPESLYVQEEEPIAAHA